MIDYTDYFDYLSQTKLPDSSGSIRESVNSAFRNSDIKKWEDSLESFPQLTPSSTNISVPSIQIGKADDCTEEERRMLVKCLRQFMPWRKGPFELFGIQIDTEWRSDWKWDRINRHISPLSGRNLLDAGCGNGYYCLRMLGEGAASVTGIDPYLLSVYQFKVITHYLGELPAWVLPLKMEQFPQETRHYDTTFSLGVLYHRRSPFDFLYELRDSLRPGGELVLETLVIEGKADEVLVPKDRYAKMRNVWFIPSELTLEGWLKRSGFRNIRHIDTTVTSVDEQRKTAWMEYESLNDFLDAGDKSKTIEGYPAPRRAIFISEAP